jgi:hypothetical protein
MHTFKFNEIEFVRIINREAYGFIIQRNKSAFGETYWIQWLDNHQDTVMHGDQLRKARFSECKNYLTAT